MYPVVAVLMTFTFRPQQYQVKLKIALLEKFLFKRSCKNIMLFVTLVCVQMEMLAVDLLSVKKQKKQNKSVLYFIEMLHKT